MLCHVTGLGLLNACFNNLVRLNLDFFCWRIEWN